jgi:diguanylate cyclase (GGDEF)-like protein
MTALRALFAYAAPAAILAAAYMAIAQPALIPGAMIPLVPQLPYGALATAAVFGLVFHRGRVVFTAIALGIAYDAFRRYVGDDATSLPARAAFAGICVLAPVVIAILASTRERRILNIHSIPRLALIAAACAFPAWMVETNRSTMIEWFYGSVIGAHLPVETPIPQLGIAAIGGSLTAVVIAAIVQRSLVIAGIAWALAAYAYALHVSSSHFDFPIALTTAGAVLALVVLQDTYHMAFRDALTGLPGRRAFDEALTAVGRHYAVAMVDIDHFKQFNDAHGHQVGDEVLRMVASRLARVGGGGRTFRYGGEEFVLLFPGKSADEVEPHLEALRAAIEDYRMAIRSPGRPKKPRVGKRRRTGQSSAQTVSVTVSIGVAARGARNMTPVAVIAAADRALFRAKRLGRNRVCG